MWRDVTSNEQFKYFLQKIVLMRLPLIKSMPNEYESIKEYNRSSSETSKIPGWTKKEVLRP